MPTNSTHGYEATTLEMVAEEVGIARRTFFSYFKSKDEIFRVSERAGWENVFDAIRELPPNGPSLDSVSALLHECCSQVPELQLKAIADLTRARDVLAATRHTELAARENSLCEVLWEVWTDPMLRATAMVLIDAMRVAGEMWDTPKNVEKYADLRTT